MINSTLQWEGNRGLGNAVRFTLEPIFSLHLSVTTSKLRKDRKAVQGKIETSLKTSVDPAYCPSLASLLAGFQSLRAACVLLCQATKCNPDGPVMKRDLSQVPINANGVKVFS